jgi:HlyD family secretion protein
VKKIIIAVVILALAGGGVYYWRTRNAAKDTSQQQQTAKAERRTIMRVVHSNGRVVSNLDVDIKCKASGTIVKLPVDVSDAVKKGDLVLELDPVDQERITKQNEVQLAGSKARLVIAKDNLDIAEKTLATDRRRAEGALASAEAKSKDASAKADRVKALFENKLASQEDYDTALTAEVQAQTDLEGARIKMDELKTQEAGLDLTRQQVTLAQNQVDSDQISFDIAQDRLADTKVVAPMDAVVSARTVQIGQIIASAVSNVGGGTTILTLSDLSKIFVIASVDESDIGKVSVGQRAIISADAWPDKSFDGQVVQIATKGVSASNVVTFEVKIEVTSDEKTLLKPEMTANVDIISARKRDALVVPLEAVSIKDGKHFVTLLKTDGVTTESKEVQVGISDDLRIEITDGISEGDTVVLRKAGADSRWNAASQDQRKGGPRMPGMIPGAGGGGRGFGGGGGRGGR